MKEIRSGNTNIYASDRLYILEKVDREDYIYYPGDEIIFTIICINNSNEAIYNIMIKDTLPSVVLPIDKDGYEVIVSKGVINQSGNIVEVRIDEMIKTEAVSIKIKGRVSE